MDDLVKSGHESGKEWILVRYSVEYSGDRKAGTLPDLPDSRMDMIKYCRAIG